MKRLLIAVAALVIVGVAAWLIFRQRPEPEQVDPPVTDGANGEAANEAAVTPETAARLAQWRNVGLGHLENMELPEAIGVFEEVVAAVPEERLGRRNLAIARLLILDRPGTPGANQQAVATESMREAARRGVEDLAAVEGESAAVRYLRGRLAEIGADADKAYEELDAAGQAAEVDEELSRLAPALYFAAHSASLASPTEAVRSGGEDAVRKAVTLAPDNLFLWSNWITIQAQREDPGLAETLQSKRSELEFLAPSILEFGRRDAIELYDECLAAAESGDWPVAQRTCQMLSNVVKPNDATRSDRIYQIDLHPLDFVDFGYSSDVEELIAGNAAKPAPGIPVTFSAMSDLPAIGDGAILDAQLGDLDLDGRLDVVVLQAGRLSAWRQGGDSGGWESIVTVDVDPGLERFLLQDLDDDAQETAAPQPGSEATPPAGAVAHASCNAADLDVVLYGEAGVVILENRLDADSNTRSWMMPTRSSETEAGEVVEEAVTLPEIGPVRTVLAADLNVDGDLDLLLGTDEGFRAWSNRTQFLFADVTGRFEDASAHGAIVAAAAVDWDRDVDIDVLVSTGNDGVWLLEDLRHLTFRWRALEGLEWPAVQSLAVLEADGNVSWDVAGAGEGGLSVALTRTPRTGEVLITGSELISDQPATHVTTWDYDNDGYTDLLSWTDSSVSIWRGQPGGKFVAQPDLPPADLLPAAIVGCTTGDIDGDGDLDLLIAGTSGFSLLSNEGGSENGWLGVQLAAQFSREKQNTQTRRVNHHCIGGTVELRVGNRYQAQVVSAPLTHFGLGAHEQADAVRVIWTNGFPQHIMRPEARQQVCEVESPKGSCPLLYTWNGERFVFVTDLCWAAPLGLQAAGGGTIPCDDEEYVLIPGEMLQPLEGRYVLQVTAELWEADYFDAIELIAVDHPDDVEVYSNEKVGPPSINEFGVHTARERRVPVSARNHAGRDLLPDLRARDGVYARPFERQLMQGYTEDTWIELDLGEVADLQNLKLFLTGWMIPTDTTINVGLQENPFLPGPQPPSVWVPDGEGDWREALPVMGFPGGKTKTIVVDLSGQLAEGDHRIRIATSMELYWDEIFFTSGEEPGEFTLQALQPVAADLHYRGFSLRVPREYPAPPDFDYQQVRTEPAWPPMDGLYTRYGDVLELMRAADDLIVVTTSGDEMTVGFDAPEGPPPGWKRDFLLRTTGWDKDADLHTIYGQTSEPLPFRGMPEYPYHPESAPDSPEYRAFLREYQTRRVDESRYRRLMRAWQPGEELVSP